jgi:hypothetical protein
MDPVSDYLLVPPDYCQELGGLRWARSGDAVEYPDGATFALAPQIGLFLEGFAAGRRLIHFGFVLHLLHLLGLGRSNQRWGNRPLGLAFLETGSPLRNAGTLCALLSAEVPGVAGPVTAATVCRCLASPALMVDLVCRWSLGTPEDSHHWQPGGYAEPPLAPQTFADRVLEAAARCSPEELRHWFRHGRGPVGDAGDDLARAVTVDRPRTLAGVLADLARRQRLTGALPFVDQLVSALSLPPRRLTDLLLPLGGYADVSTRGQPEQLLPSQFALDDLEFVRRYAEHELLYFRREEPHVQVREELVVLLDQGVRTWGDVRLVLAAAVLALGKLAVRRKLPLLLGATSAGGRLLDPLQEPSESVGALVEASDLTANPGLALERVLEEPAPAARDVILLTHPRNLAEADVAAAARRVGTDTRLFALTVDGHGAAAFAELRRGTPLPLARFQVDLARKTEPPDPAPQAAADMPWRGDVEPIGFPFRFGVIAADEPPLFDFDGSGEWILQAGPHGLLHAWRVDWSRWEVLPRGMVGGGVLTAVRAVLGVAGGFVVGGHVHGELVAVHYDFTARTCRAHRLGGRVNGPARWLHIRDLHCVVAEHHDQVFGVHLATGEHAFWSRERNESRGNSFALRACRRAWTCILPPPRVAPLDDLGQSERWDSPLLEHSPITGALRLISGASTWDLFTPQADGRPLLQGCEVLDAVLQGNVLAVRARHPDGHVCLHCFRGPQGQLIGSLRVGEGPPAYTLSPDGRRLARHLAQGRIEVRSLGSDIGVTRTPLGRSHVRLEVELGDRWLAIGIGKRTHLVRWDQGRLECCHSEEAKHLFLGAKLPGTLLRGSMIATPEALPQAFQYDRQRFVAGCRWTLIAVVDTFGHVLLLKRTGELVCMFFTFRTGLAAWMPDGTRFRTAAFMDGPPTPGAAERIGQALLAASQPAERTVVV